MAGFMGIKFGTDLKEFVVRKMVGAGEWLYVYRQGKLAVRGMRDILDVLKFEGVYDKLREAKANKAAIAQMSDKEFEKKIKTFVKQTDLVHDDHEDVQDLTELTEEEVKEKYKNVELEEDIIFEEEVVVKSKPDDDVEQMPDIEPDVVEPMETGDENLDMAEINAIESILSNGHQESGNGDPKESRQISDKRNITSNENTSKKRKISEHQPSSDQEQEVDEQDEENKRKSAQDAALAESGAAWTAFKEKYLKDDDDNPQIVFVDGIPKSAKWADIYNFFSTIEDIEETHIYGNPKYGFKGQVTLAFKSEEAARAFVKSKVMYGNVELSKQSKRDFGIYNCLNKTQFGQHKYHRHNRYLERFVRANSDRFSAVPDIANSAAVGDNAHSDTDHIVYVRGFPIDVTHQKVLEFSKSIDNLHGAWRFLIMPMDDKAKETFSGAYVMSFNSVKDAQKFVSEEQSYEEHKLECILWKTFGEYLSLLYRPDNFIDLDKEANKEQRAVFIGQTENCDEESDQTSKLKKSLKSKSVKNIYMCPASKFLSCKKRNDKGLSLIYIVTFKNNMATKSNLRSWVRDPEVFKSHFRLLSLSEYLKAQTSLLQGPTFDKARTLPETDLDRIKLVATKIYFYMGLRKKRAIVQTSNYPPSSAYTDYPDVVVCRFPAMLLVFPNNVSPHPPHRAAIQQYMKDNHPRMLDFFMVDFLHYIRFESAEAAYDFKTLDYVHYKGRPVKRFFYSDCNIKSPRISVNFTNRESQSIKEPKRVEALLEKLKKVTGKAWTCLVAKIHLQSSKSSFPKTERDALEAKIFNCARKFPEIPEKCESEWLDGGSRLLEFHVYLPASSSSETMLKILAELRQIRLKDAELKLSTLEVSAEEYSGRVLLDDRHLEKRDETKNGRPSSKRSRVSETEELEELDLEDV